MLNQATRLRKINDDSAHFWRRLCSIPAAEALNLNAICITDYSATIKKRKAEMKESVDLIEQIIREGAISDANLRLLVDSIVVSERDKKLQIKINLNAKFEPHKDCYDEDGNLTERMFIA